MNVPMEIIALMVAVFAVTWAVYGIQTALLAVAMWTVAIVALWCLIWIPHFVHMKRRRKEILRNWDESSRF